MGNIITFITNGILQMFSILENFEFLGTNMLKFSVTILIIGTLIPVLLTLTNYNIKNSGEKVEKYNPRHAEGRNKPVNKTRSERYK